MKTFEFTLARKETPITIDGDPYVLVELDGRERDRYLGELSKRVVAGSGNSPSGVKNFDALQGSLVAACLYRCEGNHREPIPVKTIQEWPASVVSDLFKEAQRLSSLNEKVEEGND